MATGRAASRPFLFCPGRQAIKPLGPKALPAASALNAFGAISKASLANVQPTTHPCALGSRSAQLQLCRENTAWDVSMEAPGSTRPVIQVGHCTKLPRRGLLEFAWSQLSTYQARAWARAAFFFSFIFIHI